MKRNNKALYEQIMRNVSREVKKALNESRYSNNHQEAAIIKLMTLARVRQLRLTNKQVELHSYMPPESISIYNGQLEIGGLFNKYNTSKLNNKDWDNLFYGVRDNLYIEFFSDDLSASEYNEFADWVYSKA